MSLLFADLAGFTAISRKLSANELANLLNDLFSRPDKLVEEHAEAWRNCYNSKFVEL